MRKGLKRVGGLLLIVLIACLGFIAYLSVNEYKPQEREDIPTARGTTRLTKSMPISVTTFNIGYGGLGETADFFMDGGKQVQPKTKEVVEENLSGIAQSLKQCPSDIYLLQEVDRQSKRSYGINQEQYLREQLQMTSVFAYNFKVPYVPIPLPPVGRVESGLMTLTHAEMSEASRLSLPNPFKWPVRLSNLKRGLLETRFKLEDSDKELVVINLHLEAYDNGSGKIEQSKRLGEALEKEYHKGNYVIAGGDFNQVFEGSHRFPDTGKEGWKPGNLSQKDLPDHFSYTYDDRYPTVRVLNAPYTHSYETSQVYVIDGFIVSDNIDVTHVNVMNLEFEHSDHHPVQLEMRLKP